MPRRKYRSHYGYAPATISEAAEATLGAARTAHQIRRADRYERACTKAGINTMNAPTHILLKLRVKQYA